MLRIFILLFIVTPSFAQQNTKDSELDSIIKYRNLSSDSNLDIQSRIDYANKAIILSKQTGQDSTILYSYKKLSALYLNEDNYQPLKAINKKILNLAKKIKDSSSIGNAFYILGYVSRKEIKSDSAYQYYYEAAKIFNNIKDYKNESEVLLNMASIQESERDFIGAEINAIKAKKILENLPKTESNLDTLWSVHNLIGIIYGELQYYDQALEYHQLAIETSKDMEYNYYNMLYSKSNIATIYRRKGDYINAKKKFEEILEDKNLKTNDSLSYSVITADLAYSKYLIDKTDPGIYDLFEESMTIAKKLDDQLAIMSSGAFFAEYLHEIGKIDSAKYYNNLSYNIAKTAKENEFVFQTLKTKAEINKDSSRVYLNEYIKLSDSLVLAERSIRNKFARIEFETDEIIQENQQISKQRLWLIITSVGLLFTLFFLYIIKSQREKNKELQLERQQQEANEEIYNLMLSQQDKIDEARSFEKNRISKDIHDGILGKLFGVRLSLDGLNQSTTEEATQKRSAYISELKNIEEEIRKVSHELNSDFIQQSGYLDIVKTLVDTQMTAYNIKYTLTADQTINWDSLNNKVKIHIYRILQETMQNAYKHAKATMVDISFKFEKNILTLTVSDNGEGFDLQKAKKGIGLKNIDSRIKEIDGKLDIKTQKNQGTTIIINVPIINN
ncbi:tetratricopeptide repeat-containing sensor histidine kinase [Olleya aquimaris]|uniref:histidine kinase n=1 Tax=Olleya aquimaris TaxID=639310 RepID=A0A327RQ35_9FLAO|nr:sensor histidine kinase [Olleya aquimaris]RAJ18148.1 signal transduction histidine kinase [Olleya aquimaris]